jgi:hypothetical protein
MTKPPPGVSKEEEDDEEGPPGVLEEDESPLISPWSHLMKPPLGTREEAERCDGG